jgi:hypothetical protein
VQDVAAEAMQEWEIATHLMREAQRLRGDVPELGGESVRLFN